MLFWETSWHLPHGTGRSCGLDPQILKLFYWRESKDVAVHGESEGVEVLGPPVDKL